MKGHHAKAHKLNVQKGFLDGETSRLKLEIDFFGTKLIAILRERDEATIDLYSAEKETKSFEQKKMTFLAEIEHLRFYNEELLRMMIDELEMNNQYLNLQKEQEKIQQVET